MNEFVHWEILGTYAGCMSMVIVLTQFTKGLPFIKKIPTQIWSYVMALIVLLLACAFTSGITLDIFFQAILNAVLVSIGANGGYGLTKKIIDVTTKSEADG